jgi:hypothetical protein
MRNAFYAFSIEQNPHKAAHYMDEAWLEDVLDAHRLGNAFQTKAWARQIGFPEAAFLDRLEYVMANEPQRTLAVLDVTIGLKERAMAYMVKKLFMEGNSLLSRLRDGNIPDEARRGIIDYMLHVMEIYKSQLEGDISQPAMTLEFWQGIISALLMRGVLREAEDAYVRDGVRANGFNIGDAGSAPREKDIWDHLEVLGFKRGDGLPKRGEARKAMGRLTHLYHEDLNPKATPSQKEANKNAYNDVMEAWRFVEDKLPK